MIQSNVPVGKLLADGDRNWNGGAAKLPTQSSDPLDSGPPPGDGLQGRTPRTRTGVSGAGTEDLLAFVDGMDWERIGAELDAVGCTTTGQILDPALCAAVADGYASDGQFRSRVVMARHGFGRGEYKYYAYPLPDPIEQLRTALYRHLAPVANRWSGTLGTSGSFPASHGDYLASCHAAGQERPTPLLLQYGEGDYNCLHQDIYGDLHFPLQVAFLLDRPGIDFTGGEFVMTEQRPRMQSRAEVASLRQGEGVIFAVNQRPVRGSRGAYRVAMRHGVSRLRSGKRRTLGIIFHDAR